MTNNYVNFSVDRTETFAKTIIFKNDDGSLMDLTGYVFQFILCPKDGADMVFDVSTGHLTIVPASGEVRILIDVDDYPPATISTHRLHYTAPDGFKSNPLKGNFVILENCSHG